ncbi:MAG: tyrosine-type recombinase/integrase [Solirubrobacteraceae bacterium]
MSALSPLLQKFFTDRLIRQRHASPHTIASYCDTFRLLLKFVKAKTGKASSKLTLEDLDAPLIGTFLDHLENTRGNTVRTRNARLTAIHSFFHFAELEVPEQAALIQRVLAIPDKRLDTALISYLERPEIEALLRSPDCSTWIGRRDHALLLLAVQSGLRVSELAGLRCCDVQLGSGAHVRCDGKGRKERCTPLTRSTTAVLRGWLRECGGQGHDPLFPSSSGQHLTRNAIWRLVIKHAEHAKEHCPSIQAKHVTPHVLRHTAAMTLLHAGVDTSVIALWLGHESLTSTTVYLHADMAIKEQALERTTPATTKQGRYRPPKELEAFLDQL